MKISKIIIFICFGAATLSAQKQGSFPLPNQSDTTRLKYVQTSEWGFAFGWGTFPYTYKGFELLSAKLSAKYPNSVVKLANRNSMKALVLYLYYKKDSFSYIFGGRLMSDESATNQEAFLSLTYNFFDFLYAGASANILRIDEGIKVGATITSDQYSNTTLDAINIKGTLPSFKLYTGIQLKIFLLEGGYSFSLSEGTSIENVDIKTTSSGFYADILVKIPIGGK